MHRQRKPRQQAYFLGVNYFFSERIYGFNVDLDISTISLKNWAGVKFGFSFGPSWASYGHDLPNSYLMEEARKQMRGNTLESIKTPDKTDGGLLANAKCMFVKGFGKNLVVAAGPGINYFSRQSISVATISSDRLNEYSEYTQVPYISAMLAPGIEINLQPGGKLAFDYGYIFLPQGRGGMHQIGISYIIATS